MATIEERAHNYAITNESNIQDWDGDYEIMVMSYKEGASDQDKIARQEERERCINAAQDAICDLCCGCPKIGYNCAKMNNIRKAIENNEN